MTFPGEVIQIAQSYTAYKMAELESESGSGLVHSLPLPIVAPSYLLSLLTAAKEALNFAPSAPSVGCVKQNADSLLQPSACRAWP